LLTVIAIGIVVIAWLVVIGGFVVKWMAPKDPKPTIHSMTRLRRDQIDRLVAESKIED
jgi:hypothetical protein